VTPAGFEPALPPKAGNETNCNRYPNNGTELQYASGGGSNAYTTLQPVTTPKTSGTE